MPKTLSAEKQSAADVAITNPILHAHECAYADAAETLRQKVDSMSDGDFLELLKTTTADLWEDLYNLRGTMQMLSLDMAYDIFDGRDEDEEQFKNVLRLAYYATDRVTKIANTLNNIVDKRKEPA